MMSNQLTPVEQTLLQFIRDMKKLGIDVNLEGQEPKFRWASAGGLPVPGRLFGRARIVGYTVRLWFSIPEKMMSQP